MFHFCYVKLTQQVKSLHQAHENLHIHADIKRFPTHGYQRIDVQN